MDINTLTYKIIGLSYKIHNTLGAGFLESLREFTKNRFGQNRHFRFAARRAGRVLRG